MDEDESKLMLGRRPDLESLITQAEGWPAVLALAAGTGRIRLPGGAMPAELYEFIAEELYQFCATGARSCERLFLFIHVSRPCPRRAWTKASFEPGNG